MLRKSTNELAMPSGGGPRPSSPQPAEFPGVDQPYTTGESPVGILFYQAKESFWLPYQLLQSMSMQPDRLTLAFATEDIVIDGRGLHPLFLGLAKQVVWQIVEQGERYAGVSNAPTCVVRIQRIPRSEKQR